MAQEPVKRAGPMLRAGLPDVLVTGMPIRWTNVSPSPIASATEVSAADLAAEFFGP